MARETGYEKRNQSSLAKNAGVPLELIFFEITSWLCLARDRHFFARFRSENPILERREKIRGFQDARCVSCAIKKFGDPLTLREQARRFKGA